jgi:hypothetical protein
MQANMAVCIEVMMVVKFGTVLVMMVAIGAEAAILQK